ncbi:MAG: hypothetical protein ACOYKZ_07960 [Chlamydiia bacterium]
MIKRATISLALSASMTILHGMPTYLWQDQVEQVEKRFAAKAQIASPPFKGGQIGYVRVDGTYLTLPIYSYENETIGSHRDALLALLDISENWARIFAEDQELNELFQLFTYRKTFPVGCSVSCSKPYAPGRKRHIFARCDQGEIFWRPDDTHKSALEQPIQDVLKQIEDPSRWPLIYKATKEWLEHPQISEERANELLDRELERRQQRNEQAGGKLQNVPQEWKRAPAIKLLEYLESKGCVVLSLQSLKPNARYDALPPESSMQFRASVGSRKARTLDESYCLALECIEFLQTQLEPLQNRLNKRPKDLGQAYYDRWLGYHRIPIDLSINLPAPTDGGGEGTPVVVTVRLHDVMVHCIPPYATPEQQSMKVFSYWRQSDKWALLEGFPKTKELVEAIKVLHF